MRSTRSLGGRSDVLSRERSVRKAPRPASPTSPPPATQDKYGLKLQQKNEGELEVVTIRESTV